MIGKYFALVLVFYILQRFVRYLIQQWHIHQQLKLIPGPGIVTSLKLAWYSFTANDSVKLALDANRVNTDICNKYGQEKGVVKLWTFILNPWIMVCDAKVAREAMNHLDLGNKGDTYTIFKNFITREGLLTCDEIQAKRFKKYFGDHFKFDVLDSKIATTQANLKHFTCRIEKFIDQNCGYCSDVKTLISTFVLDSLGENVLGEKFNSQLTGTEPSFIRNFVALIELAPFATLHLSNFIPNKFLSFIALLLSYRTWSFHTFRCYVAFHWSMYTLVFKKCVKLLYLKENVEEKASLLDEIVKSRVGRGGFVSKLKGFQEAFSHSVTFLLSGFETTTSVLSWLLYMLAHHSEIQTKICSEIDTFLADLAVSNQSIDVWNIRRLKYLDSCIYETIRMVPQAPYISRKARTDVHLENSAITLPASSEVYILFQYIQAQENNFQNSSEYKPERFVESQMLCDSSAFIPFSGGSRVCIGKDYAMLQMKLFLIELFSKYTISPLDEYLSQKPTHISLQRPAHYGLRFHKR